MTARGTRRSASHLSAVPNGDTPDEPADAVTGRLTPDQLDPDDFEFYPLDVLPPWRGEIPTDFESQWDTRRGRWVVRGAFVDDDGPYPPHPNVEVRVEAVGHGDRILDGYVSWLIAHLLNNRTGLDDRMTYEAYIRASRDSTTDEGNEKS